MPLVAATASPDRIDLSPRFRLEELLALLELRNIVVELLEADRDRGNSWFLRLLVRWRYADPEDTDVINRGIDIIVSVINIDGLTD